LVVVDLLQEMVPSIARIRALSTFTLALIFTVAIDYSLFEGFGIAVREDWMGPVATGLVIGSLATAWRAVLAFLGTSVGTVKDHGTSERPRIAA
jgi:hypothetical protein